MRKNYAAIFILCLVLGPQQNSRTSETIAPPGPWQHPPDLGQPAGQVVLVHNERELQVAVRSLRSGTTIRIAPGTYNLTNTLHIKGGIKNVALLGATRERGDVVLKGRGMRHQDFSDVPHGIMVSDATDVLIANLSVGDVWYHPITLNGQAGCKRVRICNVRLFEAGEQFLKVNPNPRGSGADDCIVEYCIFEYADTARHNYTQGMSVHRCANWIVRNNLFRNIRGPHGDAGVGGCIDIWNGSKNSLVEGNVIVNCRMGIRLGFSKRTGGGWDHQGGIIRNNMIFRQPNAVELPDAGICVWNSPGTKMVHNTVVLNGTYSGGAIEYRWCDGVFIAHNLTDARILKREEGKGLETHNVLVTDQKIFVDAAAGNLRLSKAASVLPRFQRLTDCLSDIDLEPRPELTNVGASELLGPR